MEVSKMFEYLRLLNVFSQYRTKEEFLTYVMYCSQFTWEEKSKILFVYALMEQQFEGIRRDSGGPYIDHLKKMYGPKVATLVDIMSKPLLKPGGDEEECIKKYHTRFHFADKTAVQLKMCDWMHNILTLIYCTPKKQQRKRLEAIEYALPLALEHRVLYNELRTALYSPVLLAVCSFSSFVRP
jgi:(p)ppGpp synthase/HD superfamily hydrolase